jgi:hypothetical protein
MESHEDSKVCFKCGSSHWFSNFYAHPRTRDGLLGKCKGCTKADAAAYRVENVEKIRAYEQRRANEPARKTAAADLQRRRRKEDRRKDVCHTRVLRAIKSGELEREPCIVCAEKLSHAHHESYDFPLSVTWLCAEHHALRHVEMATNGVVP